MGGSFLSTLRTCRIDSRVTGEIVSWGRKKIRSGEQMLDLKSLNDVLMLATGRGSRTAMLWQGRNGDWAPINSDQIYGRVRALVRAFQGWGIQKGDRVALLSENRWEWAITDFAALALGAVDVPLYATLPGDQIGYMLRDSGAKIVVVSSKEQYGKLASAGDLPALEHVVVMDDEDLPSVERFSDLIKNAVELESRDPKFEDLARSAKAEDLATIIYTSGTTGDPKGVMLTHGNMTANLAYSTDEFGFLETDSSISFLPLSHVTARHADYALLCRGAVLAYLPRFDQLPDAMKAVRPTVFVSVPRVYEKIRQAVEGKAGASAIRAKLLDWALRQGRSQRDTVLRGAAPGSLTWKIANRLVFSKIRDAFGGRVKTFIAGGAPLGEDTAGWFADAGIRIFEGYGLTETSPVISANTPAGHRIGSVGRPLKNVECRFASDGELEVRGPSVFKQYWAKKDSEGEVFTADGWFKTGDIGRIDKEGFLSITDRKKELLKTSGGKLIAPQPIEGRLKANTLVAHAALVGDRRKFASALISPNFAALESWAKSNGVGARDRGSLIADPKVLALYQNIVDQANQGLAQYETIKRMHVVKDEWSVEGGELTPSMKLKRRVVEERYADEIAGFYKE